MYLAITSQYGKRMTSAAIGVLSLNDGPFLTMLALALFGAWGWLMVSSHQLILLRC